MAKLIKDLLKDITDRFKDVNTVSETALANMKKTAAAAKKAAKQKETGTA